METLDPTFLTVLLSGFVCAFCLSRYLLESLEVYYTSMLSQDDMMERKGIISGLLRRGIPMANFISQILIRNSFVESYLQSLRLTLQDKGYFSSEKTLCSLLIAVSFLLIVLLSILTSSVAFGFAAVIIGLIAVSMSTHYAKDKNRDVLCESIPDALRSMSSCFFVGLSLHQTFVQVASELNNPLGKIFRQAAYEMEAGKTTSEALGIFRNTSISELSFIAVALNVQHTSGGSLYQVLQSVQESVENELALRRSLKVQTAQAKLSAHIVSLMPFLLVAIFSLISEDFLAPFFQSALGIALLGLAVGMQIGGILLVRKFLHVRVD